MDPIEVTSVAALKSFTGQETNVGPWVTVTQDLVNQFADATGDHQFIHVDPERARHTPFGGTIAHGFFTLSMLAGFLIHDQQGLQLHIPHRMMVNYGLNKVRFPAPVPVGNRIRLHSRLLNVEEAPDNSWAQITRAASVEVEGSERPALVAETISRIYF